MDLQAILDVYACASYVVEYVNKANRGVSHSLSLHISWHSRAKPLLFFECTLTVPGVFLVGIFFLYPLVVSGPLVDGLVQYLVNNVCRRNWWHVSNLRDPVDVVSE
ncbi:uncharacterized protein LOC144116089 [Amblyomma americanum]